MIPAVDSYSYHRHFGFAYPGLEQDPGWRMTIDQFLDRTVAMGARGVSLESCFLDDFGSETIAELKERLDRRDLERVWAWGHPRGLHSGTDSAALDDLIAHVDVAARLGATVMRICAGGRGTRPADWTGHRRALLPMLTRAAEAGAEKGVTLAIENHLDLYADELLELVETVASPALGICLDTANNLRLGEDPLEVARKLAPFTRSTHVKDIAPTREGAADFASWPSVPLGQGCVPLGAILELLDAEGYSGLLAVEIDLLHPHYGDEDAAVAQSLTTLTDLLGR